MQPFHCTSTYDINCLSMNSMIRNRRKRGSQGNNSSEIQKYKYKGSFWWGKGVVGSSSYIYPFFQKDSELDIRYGQKYLTPIKVPSWSSCVIIWWKHLPATLQLHHHSFDLYLKKMSSRHTLAWANNFLVLYISKNLWLLVKTKK